MPAIMLNFLPLLLLFGLLFWSDYQNLKNNPEQACQRWHTMQQQGFAVFLLRQVGMVALASLITINLLLWLLYRKQPAEWSFFPSDSLALVLALSMLALLMIHAVALWLMYARMCKDK